MTINAEKAISDQSFQRNVNCDRCSSAFRKLPSKFELMLVVVVLSLIAAAASQLNCNDGCVVGQCVNGNCTVPQYGTCVRFNASGSTQYSAPSTTAQMVGRWQAGDVATVLGGPIRAADGTCSSTCSGTAHAHTRSSAALPRYRGSASAPAATRFRAKSVWRAAAARGATTASTKLLRRAS